jgi:hypothetical protein
LALAGAGFVNALVMRSNEMVNGIRIFDEEENLVGRSKAAAWKAVM